MVTVIKDDTTNQLQFYGKSTDTKPTGKVNGEDIPNASFFFEIDTQNVIFFDGDTKAWLTD